MQRIETGIDHTQDRGTPSLCMATNMDRRKEKVTWGTMQLLGGVTKCYATQ